MKNFVTWLFNFTPCPNVSVWKTFFKSTTHHTENITLKNFLIQFFKEASP